MAVVQSLLLHRSETWVLSTRMQRVLVGFHHRVALSLTGRQTQKGQDRGWVYPPPEDAMEDAGLQKVDTYVSCRQNTLDEYIATMTIIDLCLVAKQRPGPRVTMQWWV